MLRLDEHNAETQPLHWPTTEGPAMRGPDFLIVGAPKCGTTAMDAYLSQHPDIYMARKELHYFAGDLLPQNDKMRDFNNYQKCFLAAKNETMLGESSVFYLFSREAANNIYQFNQNAKIIIQLRNPVDVLASHHSQLLYVGGENITDLRAALNAEPLRKTGEGPPKEFRFRTVLFYREMVKFSEQIERFLERFGRDQIHIVIFDDLVGDTLGCFRGTIRFLGVDPNFEPEFSVINANKRIRSRLLRNFVADPPAWASRASRMMLPPAARVATRRMLQSLNAKHEPRRSLDAQLRAELQEELAPEVERLSTLVGRDLRAWTRGDRVVGCDARDHRK